MIEPEWLWGVKQFWRLLSDSPALRAAWLISVAGSLLLLGFSLCFLTPLLALAKKVVRKESQR